MKKHFKEVSYIELKIAKVIDRNTEEGEYAWSDLTNHHAIPFVKEGRYPLSQFWLGYSSNPYENLQTWKEEAGEDWDGEGMLGKVVADYMTSLGYTGDYTDVLLHVTW